MKYTKREAKRERMKKTRQSIWAYLRSWVTTLKKRERDEIFERGRKEEAGKRTAHAGRWWTMHNGIPHPRPCPCPRRCSITTNVRNADWIIGLVIMIGKVACHVTRISFPHWSRVWRRSCSSLRYRAARRHGGTAARRSLVFLQWNHPRLSRSASRLVNREVERKILSYFIVKKCADLIIMTWTEVIESNFISFFLSSFFHLLIWFSRHVLSVRLFL